MRLIAPEKLVIEKAVIDSPLTKTLRQALPQAAVVVVEKIPDERARPHLRGDGTDAPLVGEPAYKGPRDAGRVLEVVDFKGNFIKQCPGTRHYLCCGYQILHFGTQCSLGCTYCILQAYLQQPHLRLFGNLDALFRSLKGHLAHHPDTLHRIGTGEFTDSLLLDPWTGLSRRFVRFFARQPNAVLELKTKTPFVDHLAGLNHGGHTIVAWSLNAAPVRRREEAYTATLRERFAAAARCARWGYRLAFHFDPMFDFPGWERQYAAVLERLFDAVDPGHIVWISLGAFRFMPELKNILRRDHPASRIAYGEFIPGLDGKMRYFRDIRVDLYRAMVDKIRSVDPRLCVYLCMEGEDIWRAALGFSPAERGGLPALLDRAVAERMGVATATQG
jgi:spore photoproduct lyase